MLERINRLPLEHAPVRTGPVIEPMAFRFLGQCSNQLSHTSQSKNNFLIAFFFFFEQLECAVHLRGLAFNPSETLRGSIVMNKLRLSDKFAGEERGFQFEL